MTSEEQSTMVRKLRTMRLTPLANAYLDQVDNGPDYVNMAFDDRLSLLVDAVFNQRRDTRTARLVKQAELIMPHACFENLDRTEDRLLDFAKVDSLRTNSYIRSGYNVIITGAAGSGKTYLANALGINACQDGYKVFYCRYPELLENFALRDELANREERSRLAAYDLLILDEFLLTEPKEHELKLLFEIIQMRYTSHRSTVFCSHYALPGWYERMCSDPLAESILERVRRAYEIPMESTRSLREKYEPLPEVSAAVLSEEK